MATVPTVPTFTAGQSLKAADLVAATKTPLDFLMQPPALILRAGAASSSSTTWTTMTWGASAVEELDNDSMFAAATSQSNITINTAGLWLFTITMNWATVASYSRGVRLYNVTDSVALPAENSYVQSSPDMSLNHSFVWRFPTAGKVLRVDTWNSSSYNTYYTATPTTQQNPVLTANWIGKV